MKCYKCGEEASTSVMSPAVIKYKETTRYYCTTCFDKKLWKKD